MEGSLEVLLGAVAIRTMDLYDRDFLLPNVSVEVTLASDTSATETQFSTVICPTKYSDDILPESRKGGRSEKQMLLTLGKRYRYRSLQRERVSFAEFRFRHLLAFFLHKFRDRRVQFRECHRHRALNRKMIRMFVQQDEIVGKGHA